jgi:hypothetical protein
MSRIMESESKPLRNNQLRMIALKSNISDLQQLCWYACCLELVRAKRTPNRALKIVGGGYWNRDKARAAL